MCLVGVASEPNCGARGAPGCPVTCSQGLQANRPTLCACGVLGRKLEIRPKVFCDGKLSRCDKRPIPSNGANVCARARDEVLIHRYKRKFRCQRVKQGFFRQRVCCAEITGLRAREEGSSGDHSGQHVEQGDLLSCFFGSSLRSSAKGTARFSLQMSIKLHDLDFFFLPGVQGAYLDRFPSRSKLVGNLLVLYFFGYLGSSEEREPPKFVERSSDLGFLRFPTLLAHGLLRAHRGSGPFGTGFHEISSSNTQKSI